MKRLLRFLLGLVVGIGATAGLLFLAVYLSSEKVIAWLIHELGRTFSVEVRLSKVEVVSFRALPDLGIRLRNFCLISPKGDTLFFARMVQLHLNLWEALVKESYRIRALTIEGAQFWLVYDRKGHTPWEYIKPQKPSKREDSPWALEKIWVREGRFWYLDHQAAAVLDLHVHTLRAKIEGKAQGLYIIGQAAGIVSLFKLQRKIWLQEQPFSLQTNLSYERNWLIFTGTDLRIAGLSLLGEGGVKLSTPRPDLSLRIQKIDLDLAQIRSVWKEVPPFFNQLRGSLHGEGDIFGPLGKGKLPRIRLQATLSISEPFSAEGYPCHALYAQGRLFWDLNLPSQSFAYIDTLFFSGGESDTISGRGRYGFHSRRLSASLRARLRLETLRLWGVPYTDSLTGHLQVEGSFTYAQKLWQGHGRGHLLNITLPCAEIERVSFSLSNDTLHLWEGRGRYEKTPIEIPSLWISNYRRFWDSTASPLWLEGQMRFRRVVYSLDQPADGMAIPWQGTLRIVIDSLLWQNRLPLALQLYFRKKGDTLEAISGEIDRLAGGKIRFKGVFSEDLLAGEGAFERIDLAQLYQMLPQLDTLFPLLKHMQGKVSGHGWGRFPFREGHFGWADAEGSLTLSIQNLVILESPYTYKLFSLIPLTDFRRIEVGRVEAHFTLREGVVRLDTTHLRANRWTMEVAGAHTLRGELNYTLLVDVPRILLDKSIERVSPWIEESEGDRVRIAVTVRGTTTSPQFGWQRAAKGTRASPLSPPPKPSRKKALPVEER